MEAGSSTPVGALVRLAAQDANDVPCAALTFLWRLSEELPSDLDSDFGLEAVRAPMTAPQVENTYRLERLGPRAGAHLAAESQATDWVYSNADLPVSWLSSYRAATSMAATEFGMSITDLLVASERDARAAGTRIRTLKPVTSLHVADNTWASVTVWNDGVCALEGPAADAASSMVRSLRASLEAQAVRWGRRMEDVIASVHAELERILLPVPCQQLAVGAVRTRGVIRAGATKLTGEIRADATSEARRLDVRLTRGPELRGGRITLQAGVDRALTGRVARVVLAVGEYEVDLTEVPIEAEASTGRIRIDFPLGELGLDLSDGKLPATAFRVIVAPPENAHRAPMGT